MDKHEAYQDGYEGAKQLDLGDNIPHPSNWGEYAEDYRRGLEDSLVERGLAPSMFSVVVPDSLDSQWYVDAFWNQMCKGEDPQWLTEGMFRRRHFELHGRAPGY